MTEFHFLRPGWLLALLPLAGLLWLLSRRQGDAGDWAEHVDEALRPYVLVGSVAARSRFSLWLTGAIGLLAIAALAGPAWERLPAPAFRNLSAMVIVLDLSWAMEATDLKPNRLERARFKIDDLVNARKDGQVALVAYAGDAFVVTPLTDDAGTITAQLIALSPRIMPVQGTRLDLGLRMAERLLLQAGQKTGDVLVLTAGEQVTAAMDTARQLRGDGYRVSLIGVGSRDGAPIPLPDGGFFKDRDGRMVVSRLDIKTLWDVAQAGGGVYRTLDAGSADTQAVLEFTDRRSQAEQAEGSTLHVDQWRDAGIWLLPPLVLLSALAFRRGWLGLLLLMVLAPVPRSADAMEWRDLWLTRDQQARRALDAGDAAGAADRFENPAWKAAAEYKAGRYDAASQSLAPLDTAAAHYNRGNALAQQGQYEQALQAYDRALALAPGDDDTLHNRKLVEEALKKQQQQQQQDKKQQQSDGGKDDKQGEKSQSGQSGKDQQDQQGQQNPQEPSESQPSDQQQDASPKDAGNPEEAKSDTSPPADQQESAQNEQPSPPDGGSEETQKQAAETPKPSPGDEQDTNKPPEASESEAASASGGREADKPGEQPPAPGEAEPGSESDQAQAQWLRRIPDDPGGLLKRKFLYQYRLRQQNQSAD